MTTTATVAATETVTATSTVTATEAVTPTEALVAAAASAPLLTTDRPTYSPSSPTVHIVGTGFASNANFLLHVRLPDDSTAPAVAVTSDANGEFTYDYTATQLGSYRVEVLAGAPSSSPKIGLAPSRVVETVLSSTTFTNELLKKTTIWSSGFETGSAVDGVEWTDFGGNTNPTVQSAVVRSGSWALHTQPATANSSSWAKKDWLGANGDANVYIHFYLRIGAFPSGATRIASVQTLGDSLHASIRLTSAGTLQLGYGNTSDGGTQIGTDSSVIPLNTWTSVELHYDGASDADHSFFVEASVDGTTFASDTVTTTGTQVARFQLGLNNASGIGSPDLYFDDVAIDDANAGTVSGQYHLTGRLSHDGVTITANPGNFSTMTTPDGLFSLPLPAGTYSIVATMPGYLAALKSDVVVTGGNATALPDAHAVPGDVNSDNSIDVSDLSIVGGAFGTREGDPTYDARADVNADGSVNILDLVLAGANYEMSGAQVWQ